jgi:hypothetical protein
VCVVFIGVRLGRENGADVGSQCFSCVTGKARRG